MFTARCRVSAEWIQRSIGTGHRGIHSGMLSRRVARVGLGCLFLYAVLVVSSIGVANEKHSVPPHWSVAWRSSLMDETSAAFGLPRAGQPRPHTPFSFELSTADNYKSQDRKFYGRYASIRSQLDYSYHDNYVKSRQILQDQIADSMLNSTWLLDKDGQECDTATEPWIVFTAGAMGAGKSYTVHHLAKRHRFPLHSFVTVDPDELRHQLPEFGLYVRNQPERAGELTRKEAGYMAEILTRAALQRGRNVLVDGTLRDSEWYKAYFDELRKNQPNLKIGILHVTAPRSAVFQRAKDRSKTTGRIVPNETLEMALKQVPESVQVLRPLADFFSELHNAPNSNDLKLRTSGQTWESFRQAWVQTCASS